MSLFSDGQYLNVLAKSAKSVRWGFVNLPKNKLLDVTVEADFKFENWF